MAVENNSNRFSAKARFSTASELSRVLGENVTALRTAQHLKKHVLCNMANISRPTLNSVENGQSDPRLSLVVRLAEALEVDPRYLLTDHNDQSAAESTER